jgi:exopolyphosphatase/guanosine-5'-triphosphate,3'-diphosphate pyrophosphatase
MILAAIDIGSNAIRLIIARNVENQHYEVLHKYRAAVRLGADVFDNGKISKKSLTKAVETFKAFRSILTKHKIREYRAVATSALREASNRDQVIQQISKKSGLRIDVIDGLQEAQFIFSAVQNEINLVPYHVLLIDIGGGSVELTFALKGRPVATKSFPLGTVRLLGQLKKRKLKEVDIPFLLIESVPEIQNFIAANRAPDTPLLYAIGTGGNLEAMGKLKMQLLRKHPSTYLTLDELNRLIERVRKVPVKQRTSKLKLRADRADVIVPAMLITKLIMLQTGVQKLVIPYVGLKDGLLSSLIHEQKAK